MESPQLLSNPKGNLQKILKINLGTPLIRELSISDKKIFLAA
ncbi:hypothetical protein QF028_004232 [Neobacillus sp. B4I6]